ncbi:MAG: hypothetical protein HC913_15015 [Microscillaceae bacterium]|nr:hypothetical protein [Microscillaceae bacterium]
MQKKLVNSFISTFLFLIVIFWLRPDFNLTIVLLLLVALGAVSLAAMQWATFLEFLNLKKKGLILYRELSRELEWSRTQDYIEDVSVEERILLNNFLLATEMPLHPYLHGFLLLLLPLGSIGLFCYYYFLNQ